MKKRIIGMALLATTGMLALGSCGDNTAAIEVVDAEGNVSEVKVSKTEDSEAVATAVESVLNSKPNQEELKKITGATATAGASLSFKLGEGDTAATIGLDATAKAVVGITENNTNFEVSAHVGSTVNGLENVAALKNLSAPTLDVLAFTNNNTVYASAKGNLGSEETAMDFKYSMDLVQLKNDVLEAYPSIGEEFDKIKLEADSFTNASKEALSSFLEQFGYTEEDIENYVKNGYVKISEETHAKIVNWVKENKVAISEATKDSVSFTAEVKADETSTNRVKATVKLSTTLMLPLEVRVNADAMVPDFVEDYLKQYVGEVIAKALATTVKEGHAEAYATIDYEAKFTNNSTEGYTEVTFEDIQGMIPSERE